MADGGVPRISRNRYKPENRARSRDYVVRRVPHRPSVWRKRSSAWCAECKEPFIPYDGAETVCADCVIDKAMARGVLERGAARRIPGAPRPSDVRCAEPGCLVQINPPYRYCMQHDTRSNEAPCQCSPWTQGACDLGTKCCYVHRASWVQSGQRSQEATSEEPERDLLTSYMRTLMLATGAYTLAQVDSRAAGLASEVRTLAAAERCPDNPQRKGSGT